MPSTAIADFSVAYADQNERDYAAFAEAVNPGRLTARTGLWPRAGGMSAPWPVVLARPRAARLSESGESLKRPVRMDGPWIANSWFITEVLDHHSSNSRDRIPVMIRIAWLTPCQPVYPL